MSNLIQQLRRDHRNMSKLLILFETEVRKLRQELDPDYFGMASIIDYLTDYPDQIHHPIEDRIYLHYLEHCGDGSIDAAQLAREHAELSEVTRQIAEQLRMVLVGQLVRRAELCEVARHYIQVSRAHIRHEERNVFPLIEQVLSADQWHAIEHELAGLLARPQTTFARRDRYDGVYFRATGQHL